MNLNRHFKKAMIYYIIMHCDKTYNIDSDNLIDNNVINNNLILLITFSLEMSLKRNKTYIF